jgi:hypothetical protein
MRLEIIERFDDIGEAGRFAVEECLRLAALALWGEVRKEAPVDQGRLAGSFMADRRGGLSWSIWTNIEYAMAVYDGRDPGPVNFGEIRLWAERKGLDPGRVYSSITTRGTRPNRFLDRAVETVRARLSEFADTALNTTRERYGMTGNE